MYPLYTQTNTGDTNKHRKHKQTHTNNHCRDKQTQDTNLLDSDIE